MAGTDILRTGPKHRCSDVLDIHDGDFSCVKFQWATWKAHEVISTYVCHQFYKHPSIAAVLALHLVDNHVKPDAAQGTKIANLEKVIKNINGHIDTIQAILGRDKDHCAAGGNNDRKKRV